MGKRTLPKKGNNQAPPVSEVLFHLLRLEADWKVEPPPLHPMEREVRKSLKIGKKFMAPLQKVEEEKNKQLYHRWFRFAALQLPAPEQTCVMCNLLLQSPSIPGSQSSQGYLCSSQSLPDR